MAVDVQGAAVALPYVEKAGATYPVVVDAANHVAGELLGQKVIPLAALIDEIGVLRFVHVGGPDAKVMRKIDQILEEVPAPAPRAPATLLTSDLRNRVAARPEDVALRLRFASELTARGDTKGARGELEKAADLDPESWIPPFRLGMLQLATGKKDEALANLKRSLLLDPGNFLIRKQIWAIENPDRFYEGSVDYSWQQKKMREEAKGG